MPNVIITGASRGLGRELLDVYAGKGWTLFPLVRDCSIAEQLTRQYAPRCRAIVGDVASDSVGPAIVEALSAHTESLDLLINNAGHIVKNRGVMGADSADLMEHFNVHCVGAWRCAKASIPFLKKAPKPIIIGITSRFSSIGRTARRRGELIYAYQIAKCAQNMLTACLDQELAKDKIRAFAVHPGRLLTAAAAPDADTEPRVAAEKLYEWIARIDDTTECKLYDLMRGIVLDW